MCLRLHLYVDQIFNSKFVAYALDQRKRKTKQNLTHLCFPRKFIHSNNALNLGLGLREPYSRIYRSK
jgi:hypothetical protein